MTYQAYRLYPYTRLCRPQMLPTANDTSAPDRRIKLLVANIEMENRHSDRFLHHVRQLNPDLIFVLETDPWWVEQLEQLDAKYPHSIKHAQDNYYGMVVLSRWRFLNSSVDFIVKADIPSIHATVEMPRGDAVEVYCMHPEPPVPPVHTAERDAELLQVARKIDRSKPTVVAGDLNDVAGSHTNRLFQRVSGLLDPRVGRGLYNTHPTHLPLLRAPVDHAFASREFRFVSLEVLPDIGSDHFPILLEVSYEPERLAAQEQPVATADENREVRLRIAEVHGTNATPAQRRRAFTAARGTLLPTR